jgi:hypothetical protein
MAIQGDLQEMSLPNLVQLILQSGGAARILIRHEDKLGALYVAERQLRHAEVTSKEGDRLAGEEAIYNMLQWEAGQFKVERAVMPPDQTLGQSWDFLLMEGLRRLDESRHLAHDNDDDDPAHPELEPPDDTDELATLLHDLNAEDAATIQQLLNNHTNTQQENNIMANIQQTLNEIMNMDGALATALVDWQSGMTLGTAGTGFPIELAAAGNTNVVRAKLAVMKDTKLTGHMEDMLITLETQYHLIRMLKADPHLFIYVALDRNKANLGLARHRLAALEKELSV